MHKRFHAQYFNPFKVAVMAPIMALMMVMSMLGGASPSFAEIPSSTRLIMVTSDHCPWCEAFEEEVGRNYHKTPEAAVYPMLRVDVDAEFPAQFSEIPRAFFTPTFIFVRDGEEQGRIEGYPGQELFWWRISEFLPR